jgi:hypothetical protein
MTEERELTQTQTAWVRGAATTKMGKAILTTQRLLFFDQKYAQNASFGVITNVITGKLQKRHEEQGALLELPLGDITGIAHEKKLMSKDRIVLTTADDTYTFANGWKGMSPLLRQALVEEHGRRIDDGDPEAWRVTRV